MLLTQIVFAALLVVAVSVLLADPRRNPPAERSRITPTNAIRHPLSRRTSARRASPRQGFPANPIAENDNIVVCHTVCGCGESREREGVRRSRRGISLQRRIRCLLTGRLGSRGALAVEPATLRPPVCCAKPPRGLLPLPVCRRLSPRLGWIG